MKDNHSPLLAFRVRNTYSVLVFCFVVAFSASTGSAQTIQGEADSAAAQLALLTKYRSVVIELAAVESEFLKLQDSKTQAEFTKVEAVLARLNLKRKRLRKLERQWRSLGEGMPAIEIDPRLNSSEQIERQMLLELEGTKERVLRFKAELLKLNSEFGPGHPSLLDVTVKLQRAEAVVVDQTEALEKLGVEIKSTVAVRKLKKALLRRVELKNRFGPGHPNVTMVESEIGMLETEVDSEPQALASGHFPSIELINANLEMEEAAKRFGEGHPVFKTMKQKIMVMEDLAKSEASAQAPGNKKELAKRLSARIEVLQDGIIEDEAELDVVLVKKADFKNLEDKTTTLLKQRQALNAEMERLSVVLKPKAVLSEDGRVRVKRQLLDGIEALESLGKLSDAKRLREILAELGE